MKLESSRRRSRLIEVDVVAVNLLSMPSRVGESARVTRREMKKKVPLEDDLPVSFHHTMSCGQPSQEEAEADTIPSESPDSFLVPLFTFVLTCPSLLPSPSATFDNVRTVWTTSKDHSESNGVVSVSRTPPLDPLVPRNVDQSLSLSLSVSDCFLASFQGRFRKSLEGAKTVSKHGFDAYVTGGHGSGGGGKNVSDKEKPLSKVVLAFSGGSSSRSVPRHRPLPS